MKTAALITAVTDDFLPSTKVCGLSAMEWLTNSLFEAKIDRVAICGIETMMTDVRKNCTRLFAEVVLNLAKLKPNFMVNGLERAQSLADRVIITPIKLPFVNSATFRLLLNSEAPIAVATCGGVKSDVLAVDTELLTEIISKGGDLSPLFEQAIAVECGDLAVLADVSKPDNDLETLYASSELHRNLRPISRLCLGFEARFFGPGAAHLIRLIGEKASINKAVDSLGMSYPTFMVIQARIEKALGFKICKQVGLGSPSKSRIIITPEAMEFVEKYERFRALSDVAIQGIFDKVFGEDYNEKDGGGL